MDGVFKWRCVQWASTFWPRAPGKEFSSSRRSTSLKWDFLTFLLCLTNLWLFFLFSLSDTRTHTHIRAEREREIQTENRKMRKKEVILGSQRIFCSLPAKASRTMVTLATKGPTTGNQESIVVVRSLGRGTHKYLSKGFNTLPGSGPQKELVIMIGSQNTVP